MIITYTELPPLDHITQDECQSDITLFDTKTSKTYSTHKHQYLKINHLKSSTFLFRLNMKITLHCLLLIGKPFCSAQED